MFIGWISIFIGLIFAIPEHGLLKIRTKVIISNLGWYVLIPIGMASYIFAIAGIILNIIYLIIK
jgi:hypothetical protein